MGLRSSAKQRSPHLTDRIYSRILPKLDLHSARVVPHPLPNLRRPRARRFESRG